MWSEDRALIRPVARAIDAPAPARKGPVKAFLSVEKLAKAYVPAKPVFADVSFTIDKGEFVCVIGHSGCGKTTILNVMAGLDSASAGDVIMDGKEIKRLHAPKGGFRLHKRLRRTPRQLHMPQQA